MVAFLRNIILRRIEKNGRELGAPQQVNFGDTEIVADGGDLSAGGNWMLRALGASAFYLSLPSNAFGVVVYPGGDSFEMQRGLHIVPPGLYHVKYVDRLERFVVTDAVGEMARDGEKLSLRFLIRYRVIASVITLQIDNPIAALIAYFQADIAQYIRTHNHNEIADSAGMQGESRIFAFFNERHRNRHPLSDAIAITGVELKEFTGDKEHVEMRRNELLTQRQEQIDRERLERQKDFDRLREEHKAAMANLQEEYKAAMNKQQALHKAEVDKIAAQASAEKEAASNQTLYQSRLRDVEIENLRTQSQRRHELVVKAVDAIGQALEPSGYARNTTEVRGVIEELLSAIKEDNPIGLDAKETPTNNAVPKNGHARTFGNEKIETLTNTLLNLTNSKK